MITFAMLLCITPSFSASPYYAYLYSDVKYNADIDVAIENAPWNEKRVGIKVEPKTGHRNFINKDFTLNIKSNRDTHITVAMNGSLYQQAGKKWVLHKSSSTDFCDKYKVREFEVLVDNEKITDQNQFISNSPLKAGIVLSKTVSLQFRNDVCGSNIDDSPLVPGDWSAGTINLVVRSAV
jgi:hypothetical protein